MPRSGPKQHRVPARLRLFFGRQIAVAKPRDMQRHEREVLQIDLCRNEWIRKRLAHLLLRPHRQASPRAPHQKHVSRSTRGRLSGAGSCANATLGRTFRALVRVSGRSRQCGFLIWPAVRRPVAKMVTTRLELPRSTRIKPFLSRLATRAEPLVEPVTSAMTRFDGQGSPISAACVTSLSTAFSWKVSSLVSCRVILESSDANGASRSRGAPSPSPALPLP